MSWGTLTVGSLVLSETHSVEDKVNANTGTRSFVVTGQEMSFGSSLPVVRAKQEDLVLLMDRVLPVTFSRKTERNAYYRVTDAGVVQTYWEGEGGFFTWNLTLELVGPDNAVDIESRMTHIVRTNAHSITGERWHAPAIGHYGYFLGSVNPVPLVRTGADGPITVYRNIPAVTPRWGCSVGSFMGGRVKFADINGYIRSGVGINVPVTWWELNNGLVRVRPAGAGTTTLLVAFFDGTTWQEKAYDVRVAGNTLVPGTHFRAVTVLKNDPEMVAIRVVGTQPSSTNRAMLDLMLRRGSRFIEGYLQRATSGDLAVAMDVPEPTTASPGYVAATAADPSGVKAVLGSSRTFTAGTGQITVNSTTNMDFWIGAELTGAPAGDVAADLAKQYMSVPNEQTGVIAR